MQKQLIKKILRPLVIKQFTSVHKDLGAMCRRIDIIVPFLTFTKYERKVVADIALRERFSFYREPCKLKGLEKNRRLFGNLHLKFTKSFSSYAAKNYDPMQGASGILSIAQLADGKFNMMFTNDQLGLSQAQKERVKSGEAATSLTEEPCLWVHYNEDNELITWTQNRPTDDESTCSSNSCDSNDELIEEQDDQETSNNELSTRGKALKQVNSKISNKFSGAADDVF